MASIVIELHPLDAQHAGWCEHCALPSVITVRCAMVNTDTLRVVSYTAGHLCTDCGSTDPAG